MKYNWITKKLSDIAFINPKESLRKGTVAKKVPMDKLQPLCRDIPEHILEEYKCGSKFKNGDTIMARITPCLENGKVAKVSVLDDKEVGFGSTEYMVFRAIDELSDTDFLYYLICSPLVRNLAIKSMVGSSGRQRVQMDVIANLEIELPPIKEQRKIGGLLKTIDDKIELNNAINNNLEQQAQAIFDAIFPSISNGENTIGDTITPKRGKSLLSKNAVFGNVPVVAGGLVPSTYHNVANTVAPVLAISASGANSGYVSLWNIPIWASDSSYIDSSMTDEVYFWYMLLKKRQKEIYDAQTGSAQPHIYPQHIAAMPISNLDFDDVRNYTATVTPIFEMIGHNKDENVRLATTRDTLLPKLMSGELDVSNIHL
mgnify:CR=1 FL=1